MLKLAGKGGDGLGALGLKPLADGRFDMVVVDTVHVSGGQDARKAGMGGACYTRHCLEAIVLERGGLWPPETVETAMNLLERIDDGKINQARFEVWAYADGPNGPARSTVGPFDAHPDTALQAHEFPAKPLDWPSLLAGSAAQCEDEMSRGSLRDLWEVRHAKTLAEFQAGNSGFGRLLTALLARQALTERLFIRDSARDDRFDAGRYLDLIGVRYLRTLCQLDLAGDQALMQPDPIEVGRTILLLAAVGRLNEARELGQRLAPLLAQPAFVPTVPLIGLAWATGRPEILTESRTGKGGAEVRAAAKSFFAALAQADADTCRQAIVAVLDSRRRQIASFSDRHVTDFDDDLSWAVPYEGAAMIWIARVAGIEIAPVDHPAFALATGRFPDLRAAQLGLQALHVVVAERLRSQSGGVPQPRS